MKIMYIDTSTNYLYMGVVADNKLLYQIKKDYGHDLSKYTLEEIDKMFNILNLKPIDIDKIIVVSGPGSFTGIRIGMTFAKIFAWAFKKDIITITSLEAMKESVETTSLVVPLIDARRGYVYAGIYDNNQNIFKNQYIKLDDLLSKIYELNQDYVIVTNNNLQINNTINYDPNILKIVKTYQNQEAINPHSVEPNYLKLTEAEENLERNNHDKEN